MTKSYYYGRVETPKPKKTKSKKLISDDVINQDEVEYIQLKNKIANDKIDEVYYSSMEKLNQMEGEILEKIAKEHKRQMKSEFDDEDNYKWEALHI